MPRPRHLLVLCLLLALLPVSARGFDRLAYEQFLAQTANTSAAQMLADHRPLDPYTADLGLALDTVEFLPALTSRYALTEDELHLLRRHGFVVSERTARSSYGDFLHEIWHYDLPIFVSADLVLHTVHRSFLKVLQSIEIDSLVPNLLAALEQMRGAIPALAVRYEGDAQMQDCLRDVDVHLSVAQSLLTGERVPVVYPENNALVATLLDAMEALSPMSIALYNEEERIIDFSQFRVRGYYTESELLSRYFRCMMWLGRVDFRLSRGDAASAPSSVQREVVDAFLVRELVTESSTGSLIEGIDREIRLFVGDPDNTTLDDLDEMASLLELQDCSDLWLPSTYARFEELLDGERFQPQAINSRILLGNPMTATPTVPGYAFLLMGQRFTVDSHVMGKVVYDQIVHQGMQVFRGLPDPLDVLYVLGNDDVLPLLRSQLEEFHYAPNLLALRYLVDSHPDAFWEQSLYTRWLHAIRALARTGDQQGAPDFVRTAAWQQQKMNSQLASWAELRHDTLLYVKQSYTTGVVCSYPYGYVDPVPELFARLGSFATFARDEITALDLPATLRTRVHGFYENMRTKMSMLESIARKQLQGAPLDDAENAFLRTVLYIDEHQCEQPETGWLRTLYFDDGERPAHTPDLVVADVHTQPTDATGAPVGHVLHVGTGRPRLAIVTAGCEGGGRRAYAGPVASYHQYVTAGFTRLTDEQWTMWLDRRHPIVHAPDWTWSYTSDAEGRIRPGGRVLDQGWTVSVGDPTVPGDDRPTQPSRIAWVNSAPNPFNPRTVIGFEVQGGEPIDVRMRIHDVRGSLVRELLEDRLRPDTWLVVWDGTDDQGRPVASGVYHAYVEGAARRQSVKLTLVR